MHRLHWAGLLLLVAGLAAVGWLLMGTSFMIHDDEGYVLLGLRDFSAHGRLYDEVFTQYGPAPFLYHDAIHRLLGWPITNLLGRTLTLGHWLAAALSAGLLAGRLSGRRWTAWFTTVITFGYLWQMTSEPTHPGGLIAAVTATGLLAAVAALERGRTRLALGALGLAGAVLALTKINIGALWCCSVGAFLLLQTGEPATRRRGAWLAALGLGALPFLLMRPLLGESWVLQLAIMSAATGGLVCLLAEPAAPAPVRPADWLMPLGGFGLAAAVIIGGVMAHGTSLHGLVQGVLLDPLRHPVNFHFGFLWQAAAWVLLGVTAAGVLLWRFRPALRPLLADLVAGLRLVLLGCFIWQARTWLTVHGVGGMICYVLPLTPLFLLPLDPARPARPAAVLLSLVGMGQVLHCYPVTGTQMAWGSFLLLPLFASGLADAAAHVAARLARSWLRPLVAALALGTAAVQAGLLYRQGADRWQTSDPLNLPGAEWVRPPENVRLALRVLTANAALHADVLFSRPGMYGFNLWSGVPTPTLRNATHWFWLLTEAEQQAVIDRLAATPRAAVISSRPLLEFLDEQMHMKITGPLNAHLGRDYRRLFSVSGYDFLVPPASRAAPFFIAQNFARAAGAAGTESGLVTVNVAAKAAVARIVLRSVYEPARPIATWTAGNSRVTLTRINAAGQSAGGAEPAAWPLRIDGLRRLELYHDLPMPPPRPSLELVFLDAEGRILFEAGYDDAVSAAAPPAGG